MTTGRLKIWNELENEWEIVGPAVGGSQPVDVQTFTADGTWTKPAGVTWVTALIADGGPGGNAGDTIAGGNGPGGLRAGGGCAQTTLMLAADLPATIAVVVGAGGAGGVAPAGAGAAGGASSFDGRLSTEQTLSSPFGGNGGAGGDGTGGDAPGNAGAGGGYFGQFSYGGHDTNGGAAGAAGSGNGGAATAGDTLEAGGGGGGGGGSLLGAAGNGGAGAIPSGAGGGGGVGLTAGGNGGAGARGFVIVTSW